MGNVPASSSALIASLNAGTASQSASYPLLIFALLFCSLCIWFARFCEGESSAGLLVPLLGLEVPSSCVLSDEGPAMDDEDVEDALVPRERVGGSMGEVGETTDGRRRFEVGSCELRPSCACVCQDSPSWGRFRFELDCGRWLVSSEGEDDVG